jgi:signal transduction histidine kinase/DNA-binding response OmpR family regulator
MQQFVDNKIRQVFDELGRGSNLNRALGLIADQIVSEINAPTCKIWVVKRGDICDRCQLASICSSREMCMHLVATSGAEMNKEYPRIPLSIFNASLIARGGTANFVDPMGAGEKLFGAQRSKSAQSQDAYALYPLRGVSGTVGLIGVFQKRSFRRDELRILAELAPAAVAAIRVAQLQSRCDSLRSRLERETGSASSAQQSATKREAELENSVAQLTHMVAQLQLERETLIRGAEDSSRRVAQFEEHARSARAAEERASQLELEARSFEEANAKLKQRLATLEGEYGNLVKQNSSLEQSVMQLRSEYASLEDGIEELERSRRLSEDARSRIEQGKVELEGRIAELREELAHTRTENSRVLGENEQLVAENERLSGEAAELKAQIALLQQEGASLLDANIQLENTNKQFETLAARLEESALRSRTRAEASERARTDAEQRNRVLAEQNRRLGTEGQTKARFLANISHELRTPMNAIIGFTSLLLDDQSLVMSERHRRNLEKISRNAHDLLELINNVLDLSKLEAGRMDVYAEPADARDLIERAFGVVDALKDKRPVTLTVEVEEGLPALRTDRAKLQQILINLLSNAIKFTHEGEVRVTARRVGDNRISIAVSDTGVGIAEADLPRIFDEFRQVGAAGRGSRTGTGLGLAITRRLVELLGGDIHVESRLGEGSVFTVSLPLEIEGRIAAEADIPLIDPERTALVIAGDPASLYLIKKYLTEASYSVAATDDSARGLEIARVARPALVIADLDSLEEGAGLIEQVARVNKTSRIVAVSADPSCEAQATELGAQLFLRKPVERAALVAIVERASEPDPNRVLVVDDDPDALDLVMAMIEDSGYSVQTATTGREALESVQRVRPDAIILDMMLPEMDGVEVVHRLGLNPEWREIPVILLTAHDLSPDERRALDYGGVRFIQKGFFSRDELLAELGMAIGK